MRYLENQHQNTEYERETYLIWTPIFRIIEKLLIFNKEYFQKTCIEMRFKSELFEPSKSQFKKDWSIQSLETMIEPDMFENGKAFVDVITAIFEGY